MSTLRSMIGSDAEPPSVQWSAASVVSGDVVEIAKLMVLLILVGEGEGEGRGCLLFCNIFEGDL